jgi:succinoglycan biosynthesis protein ExoO
MTDAPTAPAWPRHVLIVSEKTPFVRRGGNDEALSGFAAVLRETGARVDLLCLREYAPPIRRVSLLAHYLAPFTRVTFPGMARLGSRFYVIRSDWWFGKRAAPPAAPTGLARWPFLRLSAARLRAGARRVAAAAPDLVVANYFNAADIFAHLPPAIPKAIYVHDILALRAESARAAGMAPDFDPALLAVEAEAFRQADICVVLKAEEAAHIATVNPRCRAIVAPFSLPVPDRAPPPAAAPVALFVGSENGPNRDGLDWLLSTVWPLVHARRPDARLRVVGAIGVAERAWPEGVEGVGFVDDLGVEYAQAAVALTPLRYGSGVKIKLVEALAHATPSVSTSVGAEGVAPAPAEALRVADTAEAFAEAMLATFAAPNPASERAAALDLARARFSRAAAARQLAADLAAAAP